MALPTAQLQDLTQAWGVRLPIVRDLQAFGRDVFRIPYAPTVVVLDRQGIVHLFEVGANPKLNENVSLVLQQLQAGENVAAKLLAQVEQNAAHTSRRWRKPLRPRTSGEQRPARSSGDRGRGFQPVNRSGRKRPAGSLSHGLCSRLRRLAADALRHGAEFVQGRGDLGFVGAATYGQFEPVGRWRQQFEAVAPQQR